MSGSRGSAVVGLAVGAGVAAAAMLAAGRLPVRVRRPWERTNHAGSDVTLLEGPAWVMGSVGAVIAAAAADRGSGRRARLVAATAPPGVVVALVSGALGVLDDLAGTTESKGLAGHLTALVRGEVTTGAIKIAGLALTGLAGAALVDGSRRAAAHPGAAHPAAAHRDAVALDAADSAELRHSVLDTLVGGAVVAAAANVVNLFDLRPGRALKVAIGLAGPLTLRGSSTAASAVGASLGVLAPDLAGRAMLGDTGANAAGALVGLAVVERCGLAGRTMALAVLTGLTLASERVSFTRVIEGNAILRRIDGWGRSPR